MIIWVKKWMGVSREGCSLSSLMTLAALQPVLQERKQPHDEISCSLASAQNWNVDREVRAHPKTSWLNCRCCAKPSGKTKTPGALKPVLVAAVRMWSVFATLKPRDVRELVCIFIVDWSLSQRIIISLIWKGLLRTTFPVEYVFFPRNICLQIKSRDAR